MSEPAHRSLDRYFDLQGRGGRSLPDPLLDWVRVQHRLACVADHVDRQTPVNVEGQHGRLTIRWIREGPQRSYLLLSEETRAPRTSWLEEEQHRRRYGPSIDLDYTGVLTVPLSAIGGATHWGAHTLVIRDLRLGCVDFSTGEGAHAEASSRTWGMSLARSART